MQRKVPARFLAAVTLLILSGALAQIAAAAGNFSSAAKRWILAAFVIGALWSVAEYLLLRRNQLRYASRMNRALGTMLETAPEHMRVPMVILNQAQEIMWYNESFLEQVAGDEDTYGRRIYEVLPLRPDTLKDGSSAEIDLLGRHFHITRDDYRMNGQRTALLCFQDTTNYVELKRHYMDSRPCVLLLVIDNFADLMSGARQSERAMVLAALELLFDRFLDGTDSVFCHLDEDRFLVVTESRHCLEMERAHFPLLDEARRITVGEKTALTLSIGVGRSGETLAQNERFAQQSLDMALGRGGDQAAVKTKEGFSFYGGVSKGIEHRSMAKNRAAARDLQKLMRRCSHVYIMGHRASDLDAVGAAVGVAFIAEETEIPYNIVVRQDTTLAKALTDRIAREMPGCMITPEEARAQFSEEDLVVIVDTFSKDIVEDAELYNMAKHVVVIDHHRQMVNYLDNTTVKLHDPHASSAAELVTGMIQYFEWRDQMPQFTAEALLSGIMLDTKNFVMQTGVHTFEAAAYLRERGADPISVKTLFAASMDAYRQRSMLVASAELHGRFAITAAEDPMDNIQIVAAQTADDLLGIEGVDASFVLYPRGSQACISARSLGKMNVQVIMEALGGGGHQIMAATQRTDCTLTELRAMLIAVLDEHEMQKAAEQESN